MKRILWLLLSVQTDVGVAAVKYSTTVLFKIFTYRSFVITFPPSFSEIFILNTTGKIVLFWGLRINSSRIENYGTSMKVLRKLNRGWWGTGLWGKLSNRIVRKTFRPKTKKVTEESRKVHNWSFMVCIPHPKLGWSDQGDWDGRSTSHTW
jgi:hypothetical protein